MEHAATYHGAEGGVVKPTFRFVYGIVGCSLSVRWVTWWRGGDDSKQNEDLCVLENAKGTVLNPYFKGGLVLMLPCHAVISYDGDSSLSLKLQNQREIECYLEYCI